MSLNYEKDITIEPDALDIEFIRQSRIYMKYAELLAEAEKDMRDKKNALEYISSVISKETREDKTIKDRITDSLITSRIELDERYRVATAALSQALYQKDILSGVIKALEHKKTGLENAVKMWIGGYFAGPKVPRNLKKEMEGMAGENIREKYLKERKEEPDTEKE
jgi:hypothetical protein